MNAPWATNDERRRAALRAERLRAMRRMRLQSFLCYAVWLLVSVGIAYVLFGFFDPI